LKKIAFLILIVNCAFYSCKKEGKPPQPPANPTPTPESPFTVSNATLYSGMFISASYTMAYPTNTQTGSYTDAYFTDSVSYWSDPAISVQVKKLTLNEKEVAFYEPNRFYPADPPSNLKKEVWQVSGANSIPTFRHTSDNNEPNCSSFFNLPDSISVSQGLTIYVNDVVGVTEKEYGFLIEEITKDSTIHVSKPLNSVNNTITLSANELSVLTPGTTKARISINLTNTQILNFYGKDFRFTKARWYSKPLKIKP
jgi:hypothetical protein